MAKNNTFMNWVSEKLLHVNTTAEGREFVSVSFPCTDSATGYATVGVSKNQVFPATKRDKTVVDGYKNILLGKPDGERQVSIAVDGADGRTYKTVTMTNAEIAANMEADRAAYRERQKAAQPATANA